MSALLSSCGKFRHELHRTLGPPNGKGLVLWVMLNPSTADAETDDPTIRRCKGFTEAWGYSGFMVGNLYDYRTPQPSLLRLARYPISPACDEHLEAMAARAQLIIAAWGNGAQGHRARTVTTLLASWGNVYCLGRTRAQYPKHPLYLPKSAIPDLFQARPFRA